MRMKKNNKLDIFLTAIQGISGMIVLYYWIVNSEDEISNTASMILVISTFIIIIRKFVFNK